MQLARIARNAALVGAGLTLGAWLHQPVPQDQPRPAVSRERPGQQPSTTRWTDVTASSSRLAAQPTAQPGVVSVTSTPTAPALERSGPETPNPTGSEAFLQPTPADTPPEEYARTSEPTTLP